MKQLLLFLTVALTASGCIHYDYAGERVRPAVPSSAVELYLDPAAIRDPYFVMGTAVVSADYMDVNRDRMLDKLVSQAGRAGADAVLVIEQQVVPEEEFRKTGRPAYTTQFDLSNESSSLRQIQEDVDFRYGSIRGNDEITTVGAKYTRVIRARFLKFDVTGDPDLLIEQP